MSVSIRLNGLLDFMLFMTILKKLLLGQERDSVSRLPVLGAGVLSG